MLQHIFLNFSSVRKPEHIFERKATHKKTFYMYMSSDFEVPFSNNYLLNVCFCFCKFVLLCFPAGSALHSTVICCTLKVPKCENFHRTDFLDFFTIKPLWVGDFRAKIKNSKF
jgi:hypothetical protein